MSDASVSLTCSNVRSTRSWRRQPWGGGTIHVLFRSRFLTLNFVSNWYTYAYVRMYYRWRTPPPPPTISPAGTPLKHPMAVLPSPLFGSIASRPSNKRDFSPMTLYPEPCPLIQHPPQRVIHAMRGGGSVCVCGGGSRDAAGPGWG